jgi:hypothetical protein
LRYVRCIGIISNVFLLFLDHQHPQNNNFKQPDEVVSNGVRGVVDTRRAMLAKMHINQNNWYQNHPEQKRPKVKPQHYSKFSPDLIRYVDPAQLESEQAHPEFEYVEALMKNANEDGYVSLDDRAMNILVNAIDKALPKDLNLEHLARCSSDETLYAL